MQSLENLQTLFNNYLAANAFTDAPSNLYEPANYIMALGGKRIRPVLCLIACQMFGGNPKDALAPALGIEVFHNFTLAHDDIMDEAALRRGKPSMHHQYNLNTAILTGDVMLVKAYELMCMVTPSHLAAVLATFNLTARQVCEGQQYDMDFETAKHVALADYVKMIALKTSVLLAASLKIGAIISNASTTDAEHIYEFGRNIGLAFQLQDDLLDTYGEAAQVGKKIGGDILRNKRTYLLVKALETAQGEPASQLNYWLNTADYQQEVKIEAVKKVYDQLSVKEAAQQAMQQYYEQAFKHLDAISTIPSPNKQPLLSVVQSLIQRQH